MTTGIQTLNSANEVAHFNEALNDYFRLTPTIDKRPKAHKGQLIPIPSKGDSKASLKQLKLILRDAEAAAQSQYIQKLYQTILYQLKRAKSSTTLFCRITELCQEIFKRSAMFRALIAANTACFFHELLFSAGEDPSTNVSRALRAKSRSSKHLTAVLSLIETWKQDFGERYPPIMAGYSVLVERGYQFPKKREKQQEERERGVEREKHLERVINAKKQQRDREMKRYVPEMECVVAEMNRIFEMLVPTLDMFLAEKDDDEEEKAADNKVVFSEESNERDCAAFKDQCGEDIQWETVATSGTDIDAENEESIEWESVTAEGDGAPCDEFVANRVDDGDSDEDQMDVNDIVQAYGLGSASYQLTIEISKQACEESSENDALFRALADGGLRIQKRFLPLLDDWEQHSSLTRQSASSPLVFQAQREILQQIYTLRDQLTRALLKWNDLQGSKRVQQETPVQAAVLSLPFDSYNLPTKRRRRSRGQS